MKKSMLSTALILATTIWFGACKTELSPLEPGALVPLTADQDPSVPSIQINGTLLHAEALGHPDSALLIVLHGGPGGDYRYLLNCRAFADRGYRVVFYDQRGSGLSRRHPEESYTIQIMLDDLTGVIEHYRTSPAQKVFLLGHSWGAMLATAYINAYPDRIAGAILGEPGGFTLDQVLDYTSRSQKYPLTGEELNDVVYLDQFMTGNLDQHEILDYKFGLWASAQDGKDNPVGNEGSLPGWRSGYVVNYTLFSIGTRDGFDWTTNLGAYDTKVLFLYSENNSAYGPEHAQLVSSAYNNVDLLLIKDVGHEMFSFPRGWAASFPACLNYLNQLK